jgi:hypothetical protein
VGCTRFRRVVLDVVGIDEDLGGSLHQHKDVDRVRIDRPLYVDGIHDVVRARRGGQYRRCADQFANITQGRYHRRPAIHLHRGYINISSVV